MTSSPMTNKQELREELSNPAIGSKDHLRKIALALLDELEAKDAQLANLTAERDALREGEMGDAQHSNTRAAADIYFQLVEECEIPAGGSLVEHIDNMRDELEAKDKQISDLKEAFHIALSAAGINGEG